MRALKFKYLLKLCNRTAVATSLLEYSKYISNLQDKECVDLGHGRCVVYSC
jgi:hypothetical protein